MITFEVLQKAFDGAGGIIPAETVAASGSWYVTVRQAVARMVQSGWDDIKIQDAMRANTEAGWTEAETQDQVQKLINGARAKGFDKGAADSLKPWSAPVPFESFRLPNFPTEVFPNWLCRFVEGEAVATQTPSDLAATLALAALAVACAKKIDVVVRPGWSEPVNLFVAVVLPPGCRKSSVFSDVAEPIRAFEADTVRDAEGPIVEAETRYKILQAQLENAKNSAAKGGPDAAKATQRALDLASELAKTPVPARLRLIADDVTPERLTSLLAVQGGRLSVLSPEGGIFDLMAGRYSNDGSANFEVFLKGHAGDDLRVDRMGRPSEFVQRPALTMGLAVQPAVLSGLAGKTGFRGRGLLGRFAYSLPSNNLGRRLIEPPSLDRAVRDAFHKNLRALLALPFAKDSIGQPTTEHLRLSFEAAKRLTDFQTWLEPQLAELGALGSMTDWAGKLVGLVARIAGLLHMAAHSDSNKPWSAPISLYTVQGAIRIGEYLIPHARAAFASMGADPAVEDAKHVFSWLRKQGMVKFSKRDAFNGLRGRFQKVEDLDLVLSVLIGHDYIRLLPGEAQTGAGRKRSPEYEVNPLALEMGSAYSADSAKDIPLDAKPLGEVLQPSSTVKLFDEIVDTTSSPTDIVTAPHNPHNTQYSKSPDLVGKVCVAHSILGDLV